MFGIQVSQKTIFESSSLSFREDIQLLKNKIRITLKIRNTQSLLVSVLKNQETLIMLECFDGKEMKLDCLKKLPCQIEDYEIETLFQNKYHPPVYKLNIMEV